jgi:hypothetical protein
MGIRDLGWKKFGSGKKSRFLDPGSWIRDKHPGSTALEQRSNAELTGMVKRALTLAITGFLAVISDSYLVRPVRP